MFVDSQRTLKRIRALATISCKSIIFCVKHEQTRNGQMNVTSYGDVGTLQLTYKLKNDDFQFRLGDMLSHIQQHEIKDMRFIYLLFTY